MFEAVSSGIMKVLGKNANKKTKSRLKQAKQRKMQLETLEDRRVFARTVGLFETSNQVSDGYTLVASGTSGDTYLINNKGQSVHKWDSVRPPMGVYLTEDGTLFRMERGVNANFAGAGGAAGYIAAYNWAGDKIWEWEVNDDQSILHHDFTVLPNGNVVAFIWDKIYEADAIQAGKDPALLDTGVPGGAQTWQEKLVEIKPDYDTGIGGDIVWEWQQKDHLVQDFDPTKDNYGNVNNHKEKWDFNWVQPRENAGSVRLADWQHFNGLDYNPDLDQFSISAREFSEFFIIDHSTTTAEAATSHGGNSGKGGDILYRYGNPESYKENSDGSNRILFHQHDANWVENGRPGQGNIVVFNNGSFRSATTPGEVDYSSIEEIALPIKNEYQFYFNNKTDGSVDDLVRFGKMEVGAAWSPLTGDWTGNGRDSSGLYNKISHKFVLFKNNVMGETSSRIVFKVDDAKSNWVPLSGDWDGDGTDTPGMYDPLSHTFHFYDYAANGKLREVPGRKFETDDVPASWKPIVGDWNGDGKDTAGLYDAQNHTFYLRRRNVIRPGTLITFQTPSVPAGWTPVAGDWNNDGSDTVGLYDANNHTFYLNNKVNGSVNDLITFVTPPVPKNWVPIVGNFNGKGRDTAGLFNGKFQKGGQYDMGSEPAPVWHYQAANKTDFNSPIISSAQRLENGNTLIDEGVNGRFFEVNPAGKTVWEYVNPIVAANTTAGPEGRLFFDQEPGDLGFGGLRNNYSFQVKKYALDFGAFEGRTLTPKGRLERYPQQSAETTLASTQDESLTGDNFVSSVDLLFGDF